MKILYLSILRREPRPTLALCTESDLSSFGYFQRSSVGEILGLFASTLAEKTNPGVRQAVEQDMYTGYVYTHLEGLTGVAIADHEYPQRVIFILLQKILDEYKQLYPKAVWINLKEEQLSQYPFTPLSTYLVKYQNPHEADSMLKLQKDLDETKLVLHTTIESLLERGVKLDELVDKSEKLSFQAKGFYKVARKTNSCCWLQ